MVNVIVLDRIEPGEPKPEYCVHGRATCMGGCGEWVWLGDKTFEIVNSGQAMPLCRHCAIRLGLDSRNRAGNVRDHRRADGPH